MQVSKETFHECIKTDIVKSDCMEQILGDKKPGRMSDEITCNTKQKAVRFLYLIADPCCRHKA